MIKLLLSFCLSFILISCTNNSIANKNLSTYTIEHSVIPNYTTQNEVLEHFGEPHSTTINNIGNTVWTYLDITVNSPGYNSFSTSFRVGKNHHSKDNRDIQYKWSVTFDSQGFVINSQIRPTHY